MWLSPSSFRALSPPIIIFILLKNLRKARRPAESFMNMGRDSAPNTILSFERRAVKNHGVVHLTDNKEAKRSEQKILRKQSNKLDIHARQRKDLSHLKAYAIDGKGAFIFDDAVSYDRDSHQVFVHIADPSAYFPDGSRDPIVREALKKAKAIYLTRHRLPMLSQTLEQRRFSLTEKRNQVPAFTFGFEVRRDGSIRTSSVTVKPTYIKVTNMSYEDATEAITKNQDLRRLRRVAGKLKRHREEVIQSRGLPNSRQHSPTSSDKSFPAKDMVAQLMTATKIAAGKYTKKYGIPVLYWKAKADCLKSSSPNTKPSRGTPEGNQRCKKLSVRPGRHDGVGADAYVGVTSPLRDAVDLISHMQIKAHLEKKKHPFSRRDLAKYAVRFRSMEDTIRRIEKAVDDGCHERGLKNCRRRNRRG